MATYRDLIRTLTKEEKREALLKWRELNGDKGKFVNWCSRRFAAPLQSARELANFLNDYDAY